MNVERSRSCFLCLLTVEKLGELKRRRREKHITLQQGVRFHWSGVPLVLLLLPLFAVAVLRTRLPEFGGHAGIYLAQAGRRAGEQEAVIDSCLFPSVVTQSALRIRNICSMEALPSDRPIGFGPESPRMAANGTEHRARGAAGNHVLSLAAQRSEIWPANHVPWMRRLAALFGYCIIVLYAMRMRVTAVCGAASAKVRVGHTVKPGTGNSGKSRELGVWVGRKIVSDQRVEAEMISISTRA